MTCNDLLIFKRVNEYSPLLFFYLNGFLKCIEHIAFEDNLSRRFDDLERIEWQDENVLLHLRRQGP